jgi:hypothetical protein
MPLISEIRRIRNVEMFVFSFNSQLKKMRYFIFRNENGIFQAYSKTLFKRTLKKMVDGKHDFAIHISSTYSSR